MDNNEKNFSVIKMGVHKNYRHYEERSDEVIQSHTCIFWIATKIFDFLAMTSVYVVLNLFQGLIYLIKILFYFPISHLNPKDNITPFRPPFLIIACPKPVNLSPHLRCKPNPYST